MMNEQEYNSY